eukprot:2990575-Rhodomonas_salina.1
MLLLKVDGFVSVAPPSPGKPSSLFLAGKPSAFHTKCLPHNAELQALLTTAVSTSSQTCITLRTSTTAFPGHSSFASPFHPHAQRVHAANAQQQAQSSHCSNIQALQSQFSLQVVLFSSSSRPIITPAPSACDFCSTRTTVLPAHASFPKRRKKGREADSQMPGFEDMNALDPKPQTPDLPLLKDC